MISTSCPVCGAGTVSLVKLDSQVAKKVRWLLRDDMEALLFTDHGGILLQYNEGTGIIGLTSTAVEIDGVVSYYIGPPL